MLEVQSLISIYPGLSLAPQTAILPSVKATTLQLTDKISVLIMFPLTKRQGVSASTETSLLSQPFCFVTSFALLL